ncbi:MAG: hypothetical protein SFV22_05845, partial [Saprospiraceae bacterium]|nr:hypothetical protein [Saprospiraceae bacterium]
MKHLLFAFISWFALDGMHAQNWVPMAQGLLPSNRTVFAISAVGDQVLWATASQNFNDEIPLTHQPYILRTSDGGLHWVAKPVEEAAGTISFDIVALDSLTAVMTTQDYGNGTGRALYRTTDGGEVWERILFDISGGVDLTRFSDGAHWLAHNRQSLSLSSDNGNIWQPDFLNGYTESEYQALYTGTNMSCSMGDTLWNGTSEGRVIRFTNFGDDYTFINTGLGDRYILSIAFTDHLNGLLIHEFNLNDVKIARSTDGGNTWIDLGTSPGAGTWNLTAIPGSPGAYAAINGIFTPSNWKIAISRDYGETWTTEGVNRPTNSILFTSPTTGWAGAGLITFPNYPAIFKYVGEPLVGVNHPDELIVEMNTSPNPVEEVLHVT